MAVTRTNDQPLLDQPDEAARLQTPDQTLGEVPGADTVDLTGIINSHINQIDNMRQELGKYREMLESIFTNDPTYQAHDAAVKEASRVRSATKKQILSQSQAADLQAKVGDTRAHIKELNSALSDYLQEYARTTGLTSIETETGEVRQIVYTARLVKIGS